ncbi:glycoside hydrolase family 31 protein [Salegentibacter flavus]|uniref:Alpha-glucosidase n=1 Tax=Salegentibacter flavus TaxID=287099 RepID=A0A1I5AEM8_9FLAO|nr:glycoside hydrolase family 31 protein [Salegentibacter flavus]SFN60887.1 alpha-glucosidase [Salegentibacter flavus]
MKKIQLIITPVFLLFFALGFSQENFSSECSEILEKEGNRVVFGCDAGAKISLEFLDAKNIKFWYAPNGKFERNNESFAVIDEKFDPGFSINVDESNAAFEIFTGDLRVVVEKAPFNVKIFDKYQRLVMGDFAEEAYTTEGTGVTAKKILRKDEQFFGLGEKTGPLNRRGNSYTMWNSDKPCYSDVEDPLYKSIPFFLSTYNFGIFFDNTYKTQFDFGESSEEHFSFSAPDGPFIYYFLYGKNHKEVIGSYTKLTGQPIMPPNWALGFSQSRGMLTNEKLTRQIAREYREREIPNDIIYQDIGWVDGLQSFDWREDRYDDPEKMLTDLAEDGFKVIISQDPVVSQSTEGQWKEADGKGYFALDERTGKSYDMPWPWGGNAGVVDFTKPEVADWWGELQQKPLDDGVKGFWTDMGEPAWSNEEDTDRLHIKHHKGMHNEIHNVYGLEWDRVVTEQFEKRNPNQRVFQMTRAAYAGMQRYTFGWSGDSGNGSDVTAGWENLANQIPVGLSAGLGLIPFWATDISGYCGDIEDYGEFSELYVRWLQFGIFNPLSRAHHEGNNAVEPWLFGEEAEKISKAAIELKYQLHPYLYTYSREAYDTGLPIMRPLFLEYPTDEKTYEIDEQFMFGEEFLVAPVVEEGITFTQIYLPKGEWIDYNDPQQKFSGEQFIDYDTPLDRIPLFVKAGAIIPKMPVMPYIGAMDNAPMILEIFPSNKASEFTIYEDDGTTNGYKNDEFSKTKIEAVPGASAISVKINTPETSGYETEERNFWLEVHLEEEPGKIQLNGKELSSKALSELKENWNSDFNEEGHSFDKENNILYLKFPDTKKEQLIEIEK